MKAFAKIIALTFALAIVVYLPFIAALAWPVAAAIDARKTKNQGDASVEFANATALKILSWWRTPINAALRI